MIFNNAKICDEVREFQDGELEVVSYTGEYTVDENGYIRFLSDGTLLVKNDTLIDVFLVGGGAGGESCEHPMLINTFIGAPGGSGGQTVTEKNVRLFADYPYPIVIGGGGGYHNGSNTSAFGYFAAGGNQKYNYTHMLPSEWCTAGGGSGGGGYLEGKVGYPGGSDGLGGQGEGSGRGQGYTTRAFGEADGELFAGGGAGGSCGTDAAYADGGEGGGGSANPEKDHNGVPNTGGGGAGASWCTREEDMGDGTFMVYTDVIEPGLGGSGIVIIRKAVS